MTPYLPNLPKKKKWDTGGEMHSDDTQLKNDLYLSTRGRSKTTLTKKGDKCPLYLWRPITIR